MNFAVITKKNNDKSPELFYKESEHFSILHAINKSDESQRYFQHLENNYIQLYFCLNANCSVAFNMEHCKIQLYENESGLIYYKDVQSNLLFQLEPNSELVVVLIPIKHFHSLFSEEEDLVFNFESMKLGKPIIETKPTSNTVKGVLNQIFQQQLNNSLKALYTKGKIYELLSMYFNMNTESDLDRCPFMANEDTVQKIKQVKDIIIQEMIAPPSLEELSKMVGLNIKKIKLGFKELYGMPVFTYLYHYKMEFAKKLLAENGFNVNEVATQVGYSTSSHFIVAFKKKYGITPKQFTKQETV
ncbi:helix-turn-helix transcriptional regulator [Urechidicola sp. KH5]